MHCTSRLHFTGRLDLCRGFRTLAKIKGPKKEQYKGLKLTINSVLFCILLRDPIKDV